MSYRGAVTSPRFVRMMARSMVRRCPWCGGRGAFFTGWFTKQPHCRSCGLRWRRGDVGFELGAAAIAAMNTLGPLLVALGVTLTIMWPNTPVAPLLAAFLPSALLLPILTYPLSYTMWQAIDLTWREVSPDDFCADHIAAGVFDPD